MANLKPWEDEPPTADEIEEARRTLGILSAGATDAAISAFIDVRDVEAAQAWVLARQSATGGVYEAHGKRWIPLHRIGPNAANEADMFIAADPLPIQFIHEARNCLVPARVHVDALLNLDDITDPNVRLRLAAIRRGIVGALDFAEMVAKANDEAGAKDAD